MTFFKKNILIYKMLLVAIIFGLVAGSVDCRADDFPNREIELVVCYSPGGSSDLMARIVGGKASEYLKVPVIIVNKPGAGGSVAAEYVSKTDDGYTLLTGGASNLGSVIATNDKIPYSLENFSSIAKAVKNPLVIICKKDRYKSLKDVAEEAKKNPNKLTFGSWGVNSSSHIAGELFCQAAGVKIKHVPFKGGAKAMLAAMGGHVDIAFVTTATASSNINSGNIDALAVTTEDRVDVLPDASTLKELGYGEATFASYDGFVTSSKVPRDRLEILRSAFEKSLKDEAIQKALQKGGLVFDYMTGEKYHEFLQKTLDQIKKVENK